MGRRPKQRFLQIKHIDGQQSHQKNAQITKYEINANQNYKVPPHLSEQPSLIGLQITNVGEGVEKSKRF